MRQGSNLCNYSKIRNKWTRREKSPHDTLVWETGFPSPTARACANNYGFYYNVVACSPRIVNLQIKSQECVNILSKVGIKM